MEFAFLRVRLRVRLIDHWAMVSLDSKASDTLVTSGESRGSDRKPVSRNAICGSDPEVPPNQLTSCAASETGSALASVESSRGTGAF